MINNPSVAMEQQWVETAKDLGIAPFDLFMLVESEAFTDLDPLSRVYAGVIAMDEGDFIDALTPAGLEVYLRCRQLCSLNEISQLLEKILKDGCSLISDSYPDLSLILS